MSWLFGVFARRPLEDIQTFEKIHAPTEHVLISRFAYVAAGGLTLTHYISTASADEPDETRSSGWAVCGVGIDPQAARAPFMTQGAWQRLLAGDQERIGELNGHFAGVHWAENRWTLFTDHLGLRDLHYFETPDRLVFSTRTDWLARARGGVVHDVGALGSDWLLVNRLSRKSSFSGLTRIAGRRVTFDGSTISSNGEEWTPACSNTETSDHLVASLRSMARLPLTAGRRTIFCLSGGLDSRALLALLDAGGTSTVETVTFGNPQHPDVRIAVRVAAAAGIPCRVIDEPLPDVDRCVSLLRERAAIVGATKPASSLIHARYLHQLGRNDGVVLDGGFGEIWRNGFLNRLRYGSGRLTAGNEYVAMQRHLAASRGDIFSHDFDIAMRAGMIAELRETIESMPSPQRIGSDNWLDLLSIRTRFVNYYGPEQAWMDSACVGYMPFAQPSLLVLLFASSPRLRHGGRLVRQIVRSVPRYARIPLVKGNITVPMRVPELFAKVMSKGLARFGYRDASRTAFLRHLEPFVRDLASSEEVRQAGLYDHAKLSAIVNGFFAGDDACAGPLDWWWRSRSNARCTHSDAVSLPNACWNDAPRSPRSLLFPRR